MTIEVTQRLLQSYIYWWVTNKFQKPVVIDYPYDLLMLYSFLQVPHGITVVILSTYSAKIQWSRFNSQTYFFCTYVYAKFRTNVHSVPGLYVCRYGSKDFSSMIVNCYDSVTQLITAAMSLKILRVCVCCIASDIILRCHAYYGVSVISVYEWTKEMNVVSK